MSETSTYHLTQAIRALEAVQVWLPTVQAAGAVPTVAGIFADGNIQVTLSSLRGLRAELRRRRELETQQPRLLA